ncbi:MAG: CotH kinase family protein [Ignavibacteriales bacterium]|nr:CotH kinase family protein [Ignavibacteriales bacterium]
MYNLRLFFFIGMMLTVHCNSFAQHSSLYINEFMASNILAYENTNGDYEDWIEIYNSSASSIDIAGFYLTDNLGSNNHWQIPSGQQTKTTIPAYGYLVLYADELPGLGANHLSFKLSGARGQIVLLGTDNTTILDSISYESQFRDISYGRSPDGSGQWMFITDFTPGRTNKPGYKTFVLPPTIDQTAGFYQSLTVTVQPAAIGDTIRFTLDGSDPTGASTQYTIPVEITQTSIFKARSFKSGTLPSQITTKAFFVAHHDLPVLALMTDPKNLYDPATGIYVNDKDGRAWERYGEMEYFENQSLAFHIPLGLRIQGNTGPTDYHKKSFRTYFRKGYGNERLVYPLIPDNPVTSFSEIVLRSGYDDNMEPVPYKGTLVRDPLVGKLWRTMGALSPYDRLAVLYLNNSYNGIYDLKESINDAYISDHKGYSDIDMFRTRWDSLETQYGNRVKWDELVRFFSSNSFVSDTKIAEASRLLDLDNYTDLLALTHATEYKSYAYGTFAFRQKTDNARWEWTIWDTDRTYTEVTWNGFTTRYNPIDVYLDTLITKKLLQNQSYRVKFINRIADLLNTTFRPENVTMIIDSLVGIIESEIPADVAKWNNTVAQWNINVESVKSFANQRPAILRQQIQTYFGLSGEANLTVNISGSGKILVNTVTIATSPWSGKYFCGIPVTVTALPDPGYQFSGWGSTSQTANKTVNVNLTSDTTISAVFTPIGSANAELIAPKRIKPGQYLPFVVRIRDANGEINPIEQTPMNIIFNGAHTDTVIAIKRGAGTGYVQFNASSSFMLSVQNAHVSAAGKQIEISTVPTLSYSGNLPAGEVIWDNTADRLLEGDITIPVGCHLIVHPGTWIIVKKYVNFYVRGEFTVQGSAEEPVVITSENRSEPWGGMEYDNANATFEYCMIFNGGGDLSKGYPTNDGWHTGHQHIFFGKNNSAFTFNQCFFLYSPGKVFGMQDGTATVQNSVSSFVWHGGEFHRVLLRYTNSHLMNMPDDNNASYTEDIDTDGFHIDYVNPKYPQYSIIDRCYFITGKDDAIDQHSSRLKVSNCWLEDFVHEGVAASGGDTIMVFNTVALKNDQGFEAGWTDNGVSKGPFLFVDHCVAVDNRIDGLRVGDNYTGTNYKDFLKVTNTIVYHNRDHNVWNYLYGTNAPVAGALNISYSMTNDSVYDASPSCITGVPQFDPYYYLLPGSPGVHMGMRGTNMGRADSTALTIGSIVVNEIMYNAPTNMDSKDWIELYNPQSTDQDISRWIIKDEDNAHAFSLPDGTIIPAQGYWILCGDTAAFKLVYPDVITFSGNIPFGFGGKDQVRLFTPNSMLVDSVAYTNQSPWPLEADGQGYSLILLDPEKGHTLPENWNRSGQYGGSPGRQNYVTGVEEQTERIHPTTYVLEQNYPNPFNPTTCITFCIPDKKMVTLKIFDLLGREIALLVNEQKQAGVHSVYWNAVGFPSGIYFYRLQAGSFIETKKLVLLK